MFLVMQRLGSKTKEKHRTKEDGQMINCQALKKKKKRKGRAEAEFFLMSGKT